MKRVFYGWIVVACAFIVLFLTYGIQYSFGVFVPAMVADLGWQRASLGGAFSLYSVVYTSFTLLSGALTDSLGPRRVIGLGGVLLGTGLIATSQMSAQWQLFFWYGIVAALGMSTAYVPCNMTVVRWFQRRRGLALGFASCGASCGILAVPVVAAYLVAATGWRIGLLALGVTLLLVTNVIARFMVRDPGALGLQPDGDLPPPAPEKREAAEAGAGSRQRGHTLREARATPAFWLLLAGFAATMVTIGVPFVHVTSFAHDIGLTGYRGALAVSAIGLFALIGNVSLGAASDRIGRKAAILIAYTSQVVAFVFLFNAAGAATLFAGSAAFGFFYGGFASLFPALVGDLFGAAHAGKIGGFIIAGGGLLGAWGPAAAGHLRDVHGDYRLAFLSCIVVAGGALVLYASLPRARPS